MFEDREQFFQFDGQLHDRGQDHQESPVLPPQQNLAGDRFDNFCRLQEPMKVPQHQQHGAVWCRQGVDGSQGTKRIPQLLLDRLACDLKPLFQIPTGPLPILATTKPRQLGLGLMRFVGLYPQASEARAHVFPQPLSQ